MATTSRILKWTIPVDDRPHQGGRYPVHVACLGTDYENVQVWTNTDDDTPVDRLYQVFGTGQPVPDGADYVGTAPAMNGALVWHVFDVTAIHIKPERAPKIGTTKRGY